VRDSFCAVDCLTVFVLIDVGNFDVLFSHKLLSVLSLLLMV
jgi:hypothetical protein